MSIYFYDFQRGLNIDYNADDTLNSFCQWQSVLVGANGRQHDHAILLTGLDLCSYKNSPCDTLGKNSVHWVVLPLKGPLGALSNHIVCPSVQPTIDQPTIQLASQPASQPSILFAHSCAGHKVHQ